MDVILDSNVYLSDIRMESIKFQNLFDYLRRTKSTLVVPRLVREETLGKYRHKLYNQSRKTDSAVQELNKLIVDKNDEHHFRVPNLKHAVRNLRAKFRAPAKGIVVRYYPETTGVDVSDVFLRGVNRRRPANSEGEELRDVIIWLVVLQYAQEEKKSVALVTADSGFWNETQVHEHIVEDIKNRKVDVSLFRSVEDFVKASAPAPAKVDAAYVAKVFDETKLKPELRAALKSALAEDLKMRFWQPFTVDSVRLETSNLAEGTAFETNPETKFLELSYDMRFITRVAFGEWNLGQPGGSVLLSAFGSETSSLGYGSTVPTALLSGLAGNFLQNPFAKPEPPQVGRTTVKTYSVHAKAQISVRLVSDTATEAELNGLEIEKVEETAKAEPVEAEQVGAEIAELEAAEASEEASAESASTGDSPNAESDSPGKE